MAIRSALCKGRAHGRARQVTRRLLRSSARPSARCRRGPAAGAAPLPPAPARRRLLVFPSQWAEPLALEQAPQLPAPPRLVVGGSGAGSTREEGRGRCTAGRERYMLLLAGATLQTGHRSGASPEPPSAWSCSSSPIPLGFKPSCIYIDIYIFFPLLPPPPVFFSRAKWSRNCTKAAREILQYCSDLSLLYYS